MSKRNFAVLGAVAVSLAGCISSGTEVTATQASQFKVGATTEQQVIAALGQPEQTATNTDGTKVDTYLHTSAHATAATYVPIVGLFAGGAKGTTRSVTFTFNAKGVLKSESSSSSQENVHTGLLNQH